jgi:gamma-glutamylcyclotransferase
MSDTSVFYFAYGSNADPERFRSRVGEWRSRRPAWLAGHRLWFSDSVQSEGGGGAVFGPHEGSTLAGVLYEITMEQQEAMDRIEVDPSRNLKNAGARMTIAVDTADGPVQAQVYNVHEIGGWSAPSQAYLGHIVRGLEAAGHPAEVLDQVRSIAASGGR